jgi:hypothetical protein
MEQMLLAHHKTHVLIITTRQLIVPQAVQIIMVTQLPAILNALMTMEIQNSVHSNLLHYLKFSATNLDHALIHQIQSGVNSTNPINRSLHNKFKLDHHKPSQFHLLMPLMVQVCKLH